MNRFARYAFVAFALAAPALSFAHPANGALSREQVRADLLRVETAGYSPAAGDEANYPSDIQAAEAKVAAQDAAGAARTDLGGAPSSTSASGSPQNTAAHDECVGPVSYCNIYFGS
jgi:hypothetical protein